MSVDRVHFGVKASSIQGFFPGGRPHLPVARPAPAQARSTPALAPAAHVAKVIGGPNPGTQAAAAKPAAPAAQAFGSSQVFEVPSSVDLSGRGGGQSLPNAVREKMESFFSADFSDVRIHVGHQASAIGAIAFTHGSNIFFAQGQYNPETPQGQQLLGHELTHVLQQRAGRVRNPLGSGVAVVQDPGLEAEAERMGLRVAMTPNPAQAKPAPGRAPSRQAPSGQALSGQAPSGQARPAPGAHADEKPLQAKAPAGFWVSQRSLDGGRRRLTVHRGGQSLGQADVHAENLGTARVYNLKVDPAFRGQGAGSALLREAARTSASMGKHRVALDSEDNGSGRLTRWYQQEGFHRVGTNDRGMAVLEAPAQALMAHPAGKRR